MDFLAGGISGTVSKTITAPIERVKLIIQTQDANPKIVSGEVPRYTGIVNCFSRVRAEQGIGAFWRGNFTNCLRYFPTQAFNLAFKDSIKAMFPKYNPKTEFWPFFGANLASGGLAGAASLCIVYPLDYARTRLASDVGSGKKTFNGLGDCLMKTAKGPKGVLSLYNGFGISVAGIIPYRGVQFGLNDTLLGLNPYKKEVSFIGLVSKWACAQFSVIMSGFVTYPFDTVRRRLQMESEKTVEDRMYKGAAHCAQKIIADEGVAAMFKGAGANVLRGTGAALVLVLYGEAKNLLYK
jgi:solute carrier family 25 (adenine nucleotide translocator) protein 4/5/6/31